MSLTNLYTKRQLEIVKFCATGKEASEKIKGLRFEEGVTVATNGHLMVRVRAEQIQGEVWPANTIKWCKGNKPFTICSQAVSRALVSMPPYKETEGLPVLKKIVAGRTGDGGKAVLQSTDLEITVDTETVLGNQEYPEYKKVIPDYSEFFKLMISAKYLKEICTVFEKYQDSCGVTLHIDTSGEVKALIVTTEDYDGNKAEAVIMPLGGKDSEEEKSPAGTAGGESS